MECIVLAGGLGTRLQGVIGPIPKCMAPVAGQPFLYHLFVYLQQQGCKRIILSLGFRAEVVIQWLTEHQWSFDIDYVIEQEQLGTGGGIAFAMEQAHDSDVAVINGDTMFRADLNGMMNFHRLKKSATSLALKKMFAFQRYGIVCLDADQRITSFEEKQYRDEGFINGGIYIISKKALTELELPQKYSFEKDYLETFVSRQQFYGYTSEAYFIDIGIPEDYERAQLDLNTTDHHNG